MFDSSRGLESTWKLRWVGFSWRTSTGTPAWIAACPIRPAHKYACLQKVPPQSIPFAVNTYQQGQLGTRLQAQAKCTLSLSALPLPDRPRTVSDERMTYCWHNADHLSFSSEQKRCGEVKMSKGLHRHIAGSSAEPCMLLASSLLHASSVSHASNVSAPAMLKQSAAHLCSVWERWQ